MAVPKELLRQVWSRFATGVTVITTLSDEDQPHGMTANAVCSVSLDPPLSLVCVGHQRNTHRYIRHRGRFTINILNSEQQEVATYYAKEPAERIQGPGFAFALSRQGSPLIPGCLAYLDCRVVAAYEAGDHTIFVGEVEEVGMEPDSGDPLIFYESRFTRVVKPS